MDGGGRVEGIDDVDVPFVMMIHVCLCVYVYVGVALLN